MDNKIYCINFLGQCGNDTDFIIYIPKGITQEQAQEVEDGFEQCVTDYGNENNDDYENFNYEEMLNSVFGDLDIEYVYPRADYTIYV